MSYTQNKTTVESHELDISALLTSLKIAPFPTRNPTHPEFEDEFLTDLSTLPDFVLLELYRKTRWLSPLYFLRKRYFGKWHTCDEEILFVLVQMRSPKAKTYYIQTNMEKKQPDDEALVLMIQDGDKSALDILTYRYQKFIENLIGRLESQFWFIGHDNQDLFQEGAIGLLKSTKDYKIYRKTLFKDFAREVIKRHVKTLIYKSHNFKNMSLNHSCSYHSPIGRDSDETFEQLLKSETRSPLDKKIAFDTHASLIERLTPLELSVLQPLIDGYSYEEAGFILLSNEEKPFYLGDFNLKSIEETPTKSAYALLQEALEFEDFRAQWRITDEDVVGLEKQIQIKKKAVDNTLQRSRKKGDIYLAQELVITEGIPFEKALATVKKWREFRRWRGK